MIHVMSDIPNVIYKIPLVDQYKQKQGKKNHVRLK